MTAPERFSSQADAARYIDKIIALNREHGGTDDVSQDAYERAVRQVAAAFARLKPSPGSR